MALEDEIVDGIKLLAETEGIFTETAGGVVISGLKRLVEDGTIGSDDLTVAYVTGNGLKTLGGCRVRRRNRADSTNLWLV